VLFEEASFCCANTAITVYRYQPTGFTIMAHHIDAQLRAKPGPLRQWLIPVLVFWVGLPISSQLSYNATCGGFAVLSSMDPNTGNLEFVFNNQPISSLASCDFNGVAQQVGMFQPLEFSLRNASLNGGAGLSAAVFPASTVTIVLAQNNITQFPASTFQSVGEGLSYENSSDYAAGVTLDLSFNQITSLAPGSLNNCMIGSISLKGNKLTALPASVFQPFCPSVNLTSLINEAIYPPSFTADFSCNAITSLPAGLFSNIYLGPGQAGPPMQFALDFSHNHLTYIAPGLFEGSYPASGTTGQFTLNFRSNRLSSLPMGSLAVPAYGLSLWNVLDLSFNSIARLGAIATGLSDAQSTLIVLDLSHNTISSILLSDFQVPSGVSGGSVSSAGSGPFSAIALTALTTLDLSHNFITFAEAGVLASLTSLATLDLSFNEFTAFPAGFLASPCSFLIQIQPSSFGTIAFARSWLKTLRFQEFHSSNAVAPWLSLT
jgi:Leucine-rich repeat (LRR) protein